MTRHCAECHTTENQDSRIDLGSLVWDFDDPAVFNQWETVFDKVASSQMPPTPNDMPEADRRTFINILGDTRENRDLQQIATYGRGTIRRLTRMEFQQNLRDLLHLPHLDIKDFLPKDRESHHTNRIAQILDLSRVQLAAYLEATDAALRQAMAQGMQPRKPTKRRF